jgi:hypothetical protein
MRRNCQRHAPTCSAAGMQTRMIARTLGSSSGVASTHQAPSGNSARAGPTACTSTSPAANCRPGARTCPNTTGVAVVAPPASVLTSDQTGIPFARELGSSGRQPSERSSRDQVASVCTATFPASGAWCTAVPTDSAAASRADGVDAKASATLRSRSTERFWVPASSSCALRRSIDRLSASCWTVRPLALRAVAMARPRASR